MATKTKETKETNERMPPIPPAFEPSAGRIVLHQAEEQGALIWPAIVCAGPNEDGEWLLTVFNGEQGPRLAWAIEGEPGPGRFWPPPRTA